MSDKTCSMAGLWHLHLAATTAAASQVTLLMTAVYSDTAACAQASAAADMQQSSTYTTAEQQRRHQQHSIDRSEGRCGESPCINAALVEQQNSTWCMSLHCHTVVTTFVAFISQAIDLCQPLPGVSPNHSPGMRNHAYLDKHCH